MRLCPEPRRRSGSHARPIIIRSVGLRNHYKVKANRPNPRAMSSIIALTSLPSFTNVDVAGAVRTTRVVDDVDSTVRSDQTPHVCYLLFFSANRFLKKQPATATATSVVYR